jgi:chitin synthase
MLSNATLAVFIENINGPIDPTQSDADRDLALRTKQEIYFKFILWATFALSAVRFLGVSVPIRSTRRILLIDFYL